MLCKIVSPKNSKAATFFAVEFAEALIGVSEPAFTKNNVEKCAEVAKKNAAAVFETTKEAHPSSLTEVYPTKVQQITEDAPDFDFIAGQFALRAAAANAGCVVINAAEGFAATLAGTDSNIVFFNPKTGQVTKSCGDLQQDVRTLLNGLKSPFQLYFVLPTPTPPTPTKAEKPASAPIMIKKEEKEDEEEETTVAKKRLDFVGVPAPSEEEPTVEKDKDPAPKKRAYRKRPAPSTTTTPASQDGELLAAAPKVAKLVVVVDEASNGSVKE